MRILALFFVLLACRTGAASDDNLVSASGTTCAQGLYQQPVGGPFAVFLFCDDAGGANIGVINTSSGAGPGKIDLPKPKIWDRWSVNDRLWQDREWATDVTSFAWSSDLKYLYVATADIRGTGALYKLNLISRTFLRLIPTSEMNVDPKYGFRTEIMAIDTRTHDLTVSFKVFNPITRRTEEKVIIVK